MKEYNNIKTGEYKQTKHKDDWLDDNNGMVVEAKHKFKGELFSSPIKKLKQYIRKYDHDRLDSAERVTYNIGQRWENC